MNTDILKGRWKELKGEVKSRWAKLTDDDLKQIDGKFDKLVGTLQKHYGKGRDETEKDARDWIEARGSSLGGPGGVRSM
ncbi:CsbD family protein [Haloferula sp. A504]|uniref:CsbD family protein n=1 Tax=Haloferula sp. A504 TaxID=3373601 RepID=UPI0031C25454|nr:CsbD family protein [Verrucomicrobiaceae bacterium E54]